jgi:hypothetical protein
MTTSKELNESFDSMEKSALRVKAERDALLAACQRAYADLDNHYEVDRDSDGSHTEYPFNGAGELMNVLKAAIDKAVA